MEIKTRKKKSNLTAALDSLDSLEGQYKDAPKGRAAEVKGWKGPGMYFYDYPSNELTRVENSDALRHYQDKDTYIELMANKGWLIARSMGKGLEGLVVRGQANNWLELKAVHRTFDDDGEDEAWD